MRRRSGLALEALACGRLLLPLILFRTAAARLRVSGSDLYDGETRIKFKGIGLTCTEYMLKLNMDDAGKGEWPGHWAYAYCFGGPSSANSDRVVLNKEPDNLLRYLLPDHLGGSFRTKPLVSKVDFSATHREVVHPHAPESRPIVRIPMTGSLYLYETNFAMYQAIIDKLVQAFTSRGVAVILDMHWNCPDTSEMQSCTGAQAASMALHQFGSKPGAVAFWDAISRKYAGNELVLYELFNEPWIMEYDTWYGGSDTYAGMKDMYQAVRKNAPEGIVIIGGKDQYALDAQSGLAFYLQYKEEEGIYPTNILWNVHPYVGLGQGLEHSLSSALRIALALRTIGPVIFTEFGQYCCGGTGSPCGGHGTCADKKHGAFFVHNVINMAEQYDISWVGWAWRGTGVNDAHRPCLDGMAECSQPDMRDVDNATGQAVLTDGSHAGADWRSAWATFVAPQGGSISVQDVHSSAVEKGDAQPAGFLPRPCISDQFNLGVVCGWSGRDEVLSLSPSDFTKQSIYTSILPGLPGSCEAQGCGGFRCDTYTGPCKGKGSGQPAGQQAQAGPSVPAPAPAPLPAPMPPPAAAPASGFPGAGVLSTAASAIAAASRPAGKAVWHPARPAAQPPVSAGQPQAGGTASQPPGSLTLPPPVTPPQLPATPAAGGLGTPAGGLPALIPATATAPLLPAPPTLKPLAPLTPLGLPTLAPPAWPPALPTQPPPTTPQSGGSQAAFCCFAWPQGGPDPCCSCYATSRTKPGDFCGVSEERCSGCSGGHAHFCSAGCTKGAPGAAIQTDAVQSAGGLPIEETLPADGRSPRGTALRYSSMAAAGAAVACAVAAVARLAVLAAARHRGARTGAAGGAGRGRLLLSYEEIERHEPAAGEQHCACA